MAMITRIAAALAVSYVLAVFLTFLYVPSYIITPALAQSAGEANLYCNTGTNPPWAPCSASNPLNVTGGGGGGSSTTPFTPNGVYGLPLAVSTISNSTPLPAGTTVALSNIGTATAYCTLGGLGVTATTASLPVEVGSSIGVAVGTNTYVACITSASITTINSAGGTGLVTGVGGNAVTVVPTTAPYSFSSAGAGQFALAVGSSTQLTVPVGTLCANFTLESAQIRRTSDGTTPTTTSGTLIQPGTQWPDCGPLSAYKFTAVNGTPTLDVEYFK